MRDLLPAILVGLGAIVMVYNIRKYFTLARQMSHIHTTEKRATRIILTAYIALLIFFLAGYAAIGVSLLNPEREVSSALVGLIFFLGSVFILIGLFLQLSMCRTIQRSSLEITQALIAAVEARDSGLNGHSIHVSRLSRLIYDYLPRDRQRAINPEDLEYAALLHDIGKLGVPERVLNKPGSPDEEEWTKIRRHPQTGYAILNGLNCFEEIAAWVLYHHERCDGDGYMGIPGDRIPYPSRIIAVADTYSAITMKRSYHGEHDYAHAARVLRECAGTQLSGEVVEIFLSIPEAEVDRCMPGGVQPPAEADPS